jgi:3-oxoacyl-[acyl-carrier-protein] synthase II
VVTACSTGAHAIGDAARLIAFGDADVMVAGGAEAAICAYRACRICSLQGALDVYNDTPEKASRPYDRDRDGFVMGEGAAIMVLEELEHALARGANIIAESVRLRPVGRRLPHHRPVGGRRRGLSLHADGAEARRYHAIADIDYINAHGTSTMADTIELGAVERLVGDAADGSRCRRQNRRSDIFWALPARWRLVFSALAIRDNVAHPTLNLDNPEVETRSTSFPRWRASARSMSPCRTPSGSAEPMHRLC